MTRTFQPRMVDFAILEALENRESGAQASTICLALYPHFQFREVDAGLQRLRRHGKIVLLPRQSKVRPFPLWVSAPRVPQEPDNA